MKQHKWANEIKAWADGAEIEVKNEVGVWLKGAPLWETSKEYRIKPQPVEPQDLSSKSYLYAYARRDGNIQFSPRLHLDLRAFEYIGKIPLIVESKYAN